jgi:hypothetical protein
MVAASRRGRAPGYLKAGHSQSPITDRYIHAARVLFPGAAEKAEARCSGLWGRKTGSKIRRIRMLIREKPRYTGLFHSGGRI